jgi:inosine-uridine nucleoside N-ribohydrolase
LSIKIHIDTDLGGDIDDLAALALLLRWPCVHITGITTVADDRGRRAGYVDYALRLAGRGDIPVAAGADVADHPYQWVPGYPLEADFWPEPVDRKPGKLNDALCLLGESIAAGATVLGLGPCTNLALFDRQSHVRLPTTNVVVVGGYIRAPRSGRSTWGNAMDYNFQMDVESAYHVLQTCRPILVPLHVTTETSLRHSHLASLDEGPPLAKLLARQARAFDAHGELGEIDREARTDLPNDFINHLYDPLAAAVAAGWDDAAVEEVPLSISIEEGFIREEIRPDGLPTNVVTSVDGEAFDQLWLDMVTRRD